MRVNCIATSVAVTGSPCLERARAVEAKEPLEDRRDMKAASALSELWSIWTGSQTLPPS